MEHPKVLNWGIKESLLKYIESLDDGEVTLVAPASRSGDIFSFIIDEKASSFDSASGKGLLQFSGEVNLSGYYGAMKINVRDPQVFIKDGSGVLLVIVESVFTGKRFDPIATLTRTTEGSEMVFTTALTPEGQMFLGPQYHPGQELSSLRLS